MWRSGGHIAKERVTEGAQKRARATARKETGPWNREKGRGILREPVHTLGPERRVRMERASGFRALATRGNRLLASAI